MKKFNFLIYIFIFIFYFLLSLPYYSGDVKNHVVWADSIIKDGIVGFYGRYFHDFAFQSYPPVSTILFVVSLGLYNLLYNLIHILNLQIPIFPSDLVHFIENFDTKVTFLKLPALLFTVLMGWLTVKYKDLLKNKLDDWKVLALFFLNPAFIYISVIWGQIDFMQAFFILLAFYFMFKERYFVSSIFALFSIISKQNILVIYLLYFFILFYRVGLKKSLYFGLLNILIFLVSYFPFNPTSLTWPFNFYLFTLDITGYLVQDDAINIWASLFNFEGVDSRDVVFLISWANWGYLLFGLTSLTALYFYVKKKFSIQNTIYLMFLVSTAYFYFLTRMHERYLLPAVIISYLLFLSNKKYWINYLFLTTFFFINLYRGLKMPDIPIINYILANSLILNLMVFAYGVLLFANLVIFAKLKNE